MSGATRGLGISAAIEITCGPHDRKRRGSNTVTVARARRSGDHIWLLEGIIEQPVYEVDGREQVDEHPPTPTSPRTDHDYRSRVKSLGHTAFTSHDARGRPWTRMRVVIPCPVCRNNVTFADVWKLYGILDRLAAAEVDSFSLDGLRRAASAQSAADHAGEGTMR